MEIRINMISIIMPLYNAERFLKETLQSINNQTYTDYELICVDDCSTDDTVAIIKQEMKKNGKIILIHNEQRAGAAASRNKGMKIAQGEYLAFLDGDDVFDEEMLKTAYMCAIKNDLDIVIYEFSCASSERIYDKKKVYRSDKFRQKFCSKPFNIYNIDPTDYVQWSYGPCNKLFKNKFIREYDIEFQTLSSCNDVYFVEMAYMFARKIMFLDDTKVMLYVREHFTPSRISFRRDPMCAYKAYKKILESLAERQADKRLYKYCCIRIYQGLINEIIGVKKEKDREVFYEFLHDSGINELIKSIKGSSNKDFETEYNYLFKFLKYEYRTRWFESENVITIVLESNDNPIWKLWSKYKNISIWGIGNYGKSLLKLISEKNLNICNVIDSNQEKAGLQIENYTIKVPKEVKFENTDLVIVAVKEGYYDIEQQIEQYNLDVVSIKEYL